MSDTAPMFLIFCTQSPPRLIAVVNDEISAVREVQDHVARFLPDNDHAPFIHMVPLPVTYRDEAHEIAELVLKVRYDRPACESGDVQKYRDINNELYRLCKDEPNLFRPPPEVQTMEQV